VNGDWRAVEDNKYGQLCDLELELYKHEFIRQHNTPTYRPTVRDSARK